MTSNAYRLRASYALMNSAATWVSRKLLPDGSRKPAVDSVRTLLGSLGELHAARAQLS